MTERRRPSARDPKSSPLEVLRRRWGVPARRGMRFQRDDRAGTVVGATSDGLLLRVRFDDSETIESMHPTYSVRYGHS